MESFHRGIASVVDPEGCALVSLGDADRGVFLRSAAKPFQALPLLQAGGARAFRLTDAEIALMCASHGGEERHVRAAARLLARGGFTEKDLRCGADWPMDPVSARALVARGGRPTTLHNNCSGKHAGILLACRLYGFSPRGYCEPSHPIHREILGRLEAFCGVAAARIGIAVDGCSLPVFHLPLSALARGYARLMAESLPGETDAGSSARRRVVRAMTRRPEMVAGRGRFTTDFLKAGAGQWIGKEGAEGVYAVGVAASSRTAGKPVGLALKVDDGSTRPRDAFTMALCERLGLLPERAQAALAAYRYPPVRNAAGAVVGEIEAEVLPEAGQ